MEFCWLWKFFKRWGEEGGGVVMWSFADSKVWELGHEEFADAAGLGCWWYWMECCRFCSINCLAVREVCVWFWEGRVESAWCRSCFLFFLCPPPPPRINVGGRGWVGYIGLTSSVCPSVVLSVCPIVSACYLLNRSALINYYYYYYFYYTRLCMVVY